MPAFTLPLLCHRKTGGDSCPLKACLLLLCLTAAALDCDLPVFPTAPAFLTMQPLPSLLSLFSRPSASLHCLPSKSHHAVPVLCHLSSSSHSADTIFLHWERQERETGSFSICTSTCLVVWTPQAWRTFGLEDRLWAQAWAAAWEGRHSLPLFATFSIAFAFSRLL